jgi:hypothetical protein
MDALLEELEKMKQDLQLLLHELKELKEEKKPTLPDGWRIIPGSKKNHDTSTD